VTTRPDTPINPRLPGGWRPWTPPEVNPHAPGDDPENPWAGEGTGGRASPFVHIAPPAVVIDPYREPWTGEGTGAGAAPVTPEDTVDTSAPTSPDPWDSPCDTPTDWQMPEIDVEEVLASGDTPPTNPVADQNTGEEKQEEKGTLTLNGQTYTNVGPVAKPDKDESKPTDPKPLEAKEAAPKADTPAKPEKTAQEKATPLTPMDRWGDTPVHGGGGTSGGSRGGNSGGGAPANEVNKKNGGGAQDIRSKNKKEKTKSAVETAKEKVQERQKSVEEAVSDEMTIHYTPTGELLGSVVKTVTKNKERITETTVVKDASGNVTRVRTQIVDTRERTKTVRVEGGGDPKVVKTVKVQSYPDGSTKTIVDTGSGKHEEWTIETVTPKQVSRYEPDGYGGYRRITETVYLVEWEHYWGDEDEKGESETLRHEWYSEELFPGGEIFGLGGYPRRNGAPFAGDGARAPLDVPQ
jgi:hypothetical protein